MHCENMKFSVPVCMKVILTAWNWVLSLKNWIAVGLKKKLKNWIAVGLKKKLKNWIAVGLKKIEKLNSGWFKKIEKLNSGWFKKNWKIE